MTTIAVTDLTQATLEGSGAFDVLMRANKAHLEAEFNKDRIKGAEYATVYLGSLTQVMQTALQFLLSKEKVRLENELLEKQALLVTEQTANAVLEGKVLVAQECKLRAEYDLILANILKANQETALLSQKVASERAQTTALGVDDNSVLGKQKILYQAQTDGFKRDAEQKAAKLMADTWNVRRTTDEGTVADGTNLLNDASVGRAISKLLTGIGA
jgi:hypothetical protein